MINLSTIFPYKDRIDRSQQFRIIYRVNCWGCNGFYMGKTKRRLHDRKTEDLKAPAKNGNTQPLLTTSKPLDIASIKWDHFNILAKGKTDYRCKIKETLFVQELEPAFHCCLFLIFDQ